MTAVHHIHPDDIIEETEWMPCGRTMLVRVARDRWMIRDYAADVFEDPEIGVWGREFRSDQNIPVQYRNHQFRDLPEARGAFERLISELESTQGFERKAT